MKPSLILHIGTEKTGSTAIQRFLIANSLSLSQHGFYLPQCLGHDEHWMFPVLFYAQDQHDDLSARLGLGDHSPLDRRLALDAIRTRLDSEIGAHSQETWIISSEHIHSRLLHSDQSMQAMTSFLAARFCEIKVLVYLREPLDAALSMWSTAVRNGAPLLELPMPAPGYWHRLCHHQGTVQRLQRWFPQQFHLRLYTPHEWPESDVVYDFLHSLNLSPSFFTSMGRVRVNQSLSWLSLDLLARLNARGQRTQDLVTAIRTAFDHYPPPQATATQKAAYSAAFADSNTWVQRHYFPNRPVLFPDH